MRQAAAEGGLKGDLPSAHPHPAAVGRATEQRALVDIARRVLQLPFPHEPRRHLQLDNRP